MSENPLPFPGMQTPDAGLPPNLKPNPPGAMPEAPGAGDAVKHASPFVEPQDVDSIIANLTLDRPLKLFIPPELMHPDYEYRIINSVPQEIADAGNKGWRRVTNPEHETLFANLVSGTDKEGKAYRPILMARPKAVGNHVRTRNRQQLASLYAGMDPSQKDFGSKYVRDRPASENFLQREGALWRIRVK